MKIISISRRTDIPAFYSRWLRRRFEEGYCHWLNPFGGQVYRMSLRPEDVLALVFWTRNPRPLVPYLADLAERGYYAYFHISINGYPPEIETHNPPLNAAVAAFRQTAALLSPDLVHWRYDPIVLSDRTPFEYHVQRFDHISRALAGATRRCYFAFANFYAKTERSLRRVERDHGLTVERNTPREEQRRLVHALRDIAAARGITLYACCEHEWVGDGIAASRCIDLETIRRLRGDAELALAKAPTRDDCGCVAAADIGAYDTCLFGCAYCYATNSRTAALARHAAHDPHDSILWRPERLRGVDLSTVEVPLKQQGPQPSLPHADQLLALTTLR